MGFNLDLSDLSHKMDKKLSKVTETIGGIVLPMAMHTTVREAIIQYELAISDALGMGPKSNRIVTGNNVLASTATGISVIRDSRGYHRRSWQDKRIKSPISIRGRLESAKVSESSITASISIDCFVDLNRVGKENKQRLSQIASYISSPVKGSYGYGSIVDGRFIPGLFLAPMVSRGGAVISGKSKFMVRLKSSYKVGAHLFPRSPYVKYEKGANYSDGAYLLPPPRGRSPEVININAIVDLQPTISKAIDIAEHNFSQATDEIKNKVLRFAEFKIKSELEGDK